MYTLTPLELEGRGLNALTSPHLISTVPTTVPPTPPPTPRETPLTRKHTHTHTLLLLLLLPHTRRLLELLQMVQTLRDAEAMVFLDKTFPRMFEVGWGWGGVGGLGFAGVLRLLFSTHRTTLPGTIT